MSTSVEVNFPSSQLPRKAWRGYSSVNHLAKSVQSTGSPTQVHILHHLLSIDDSNKSVGSALARFERSTLPEHEGTRTVVLRILKIITPVKCVIPGYDGHVCPPKEGELFQRPGNKKILQVWSFDIDNTKIIKRGLQLLWDA